MRKIISILLMVFLVGVLAACGNDGENGEEEELFLLEVDFDIPEHAEVGESIELKATVTYGDELVTDAHEVVFEVWEKGDEQNSEMIDGENNEDGTYTADDRFEHDGRYEKYEQNSK